MPAEEGIEKTSTTTHCNAVRMGKGHANQIRAPVTGAPKPQSQGPEAPVTPKPHSQGPRKHQSQGPRSPSHKGPKAPVKGALKPQSQGP
ncbi:unnamed protein product [Arctogadus glacialis]